MNNDLATVSLCEFAVKSNILYYIYMVFCRVECRSFTHVSSDTVNLVSFNCISIYNFVVGEPDMYDCAGL